MVKYRGSILNFHSQQSKSLSKNTILNISVEKVSKVQCMNYIYHSKNRFYKERYTSCIVDFEHNKIKDMN